MGIRRNNLFSIVFFMFLVLIPTQSIGKIPEVSSPKLYNTSLNFNSTDYVFLKYMAKWNAYRLSFIEKQLGLRWVISTTGGFYEEQDFCDVCYGRGLVHDLEKTKELCPNGECIIEKICDICAGTGKIWKPIKE